MGKGEMKLKKPRLTLNQISTYPTPRKLYENFTTSAGWNYKDARTAELHHQRDVALAALLYVGELRISESIRLIKKQFEVKQDEGYVHVQAIQLSKRKPGALAYRDARLPLKGPRACFTKLVMAYLENLKPDDRLFPWSLKEHIYTLKS